MAAKGTGGIAAVSLDPLLEVLLVENVSIRSLPSLPHKFVLVMRTAALFRIGGTHFLQNRERKMKVARELYG